MSYSIHAKALMYPAGYDRPSGKKPAGYIVGDAIPLHDYRGGLTEPQVVGVWCKIAPAVVYTLTKPGPAWWKVYNCKGDNEVVVLGFYIDWVPCFNSPQGLVPISNFFCHNAGYLAFPMPTPDSTGNRYELFHKVLVYDAYRHRTAKHFPQNFTCSGTCARPIPNPHAHTLIWLEVVG